MKDIVDQSAQFALSTILIPLLPLLGFTINAFFGKHLSKTLSGALATLSVAVSFILSLTIFFAAQNDGFSAFSVEVFEWITAGALRIPMEFYIDQLTVMFMLIITGVGSLIHLYSMGYMHDDEGHNRFFAYLNLFVFFMLLLVMGANYLITFIGWEGVGLCSYLLIGFWYKNQEYNNAAKKAFIMNRIGDLGFLLGMFLIFQNFGSLTFTEVFSKAGNYDLNDGMIVAITLLLFVGATGKSAQLPLFTWLPDAMAGPTPVSALIHAATMVTAGIYLVVRSNILFSLAPDTQHVILIVGLATAIFGAIIGLRQNDIKKVLAYSTVSQLGYMFIALGLGAYSAAFFHVMTHAFFKALLFLGAGSVIHAMSGEQDIRRMGGLWKYIKVTGITFIIGTIAISGIPPLAGFFSKDEILANAFAHSPLIWGLAVGGSMLTAFYMFRLFFLTFCGEFRGTEEQKHHLHESPATITIPLIVLAVLSIIGGFAGVPEVLGGSHWLNRFLAPVFADNEILSHSAHHLDHNLEIMLMCISVAAAVIMITIAYVVYVSKSVRPADDQHQPGGFAKLIANKFYVDELYNAIIVKPVMFLSNALYNFVEVYIIDGFVNLLGKGAVGGSRVLRLAQSGNIGFYFFAITISILVIILINTLS
ncbi:MAG: NADH-quinone oxidoreductase subunit L [Bacteroidota bacterium]